MRRILVRSRTNDDAISSTYACSVSSKVYASLASPSHLSVLDMPQGYSVDVSLEFECHFLFSHLLNTYYVNLKAGCEY